MRKLILSFAVLSLMAGGARADLVLGTDHSPGTPLTMNAGTTSGPMLVNVVSDNPPNDVMSTWNVQLMIAPESGATGNLTFQDPTGTTAPNPPNYVFGSNGLGIALYPTNTPTVLGANDFFDPSAGVGAIVPGAPGGQSVADGFPCLARRVGSVRDLRHGRCGGHAMDGWRFQHPLLYKRA